MSDTPKKDNDVARKIWLAGIGAYGRAFSEAQDAATKVSKNTSKLFEDLVDKGEGLEEIVSATAMKYVPEFAEKQKATVEDRMERMRAALGFGEEISDQQDQIASLENRLDGIEAKLDEVLAAVKSLSPAKKPATRKPAVKKAAAKKPAADKPEQ